MRNQSRSVRLGSAKMAESRGAIFAKSVSKHAGRAKEKVLQNLGKVDKTTDDIFDEHSENFTAQQNAANRLQKELNNYIRCVRAMQASSKSLFDTLHEVYESDWIGHDLLYVQSQNVEMLWQDFAHKLSDQALIPLNTYQSQFPDLRKKIDKRGRKLVDYDGKRHTYTSMQNNTKKRDEIKLAKMAESLEEAKRTYEVLNSELVDELPALYDSRVLFLVTNLQTLFASEQVFHVETSKVYSELEAIVEKLAKEQQKGTFKRNAPFSVKSSTINNTNNVVPSKGMGPPVKGESFSDPVQQPYEDIKNKEGEEHEEDSEQHKGLSYVFDVTLPPETNGADGVVENVSDSHKKESDKVETEQEDSNVQMKRETPQEEEEVKVKTDYETIDTGAQVENTPNGNAKEPPPNNNNTKQVEELYDIPVEATTENLPPGVLYRVRATYRYACEDTDELSFDVGEIIQVVEYEDPEEQEEGWLLGIKESTGQKGLFPANFTRPI